MAHKHTPYVDVLVKMADKWTKSHGGNRLSTREKQKEFEDLLKANMVIVGEDNYREAIEASFKVFAPRGISK